ncbi:glycosyltransferase family 2 protein [Yokenella regensburgei]|uniref:glycosyltransferase family 2 protein n=1 Tax=Yokenella regensburgei TaxID=158877 RepID=UPI003EDA46CF
MTKPLVSILIPVYNRESFIKETLDSALAQDYENIEIIVVDNASTDSTFNICKEMAISNEKIKLFQNERNLGPVGNWRKCIEHANGLYAKILWSDDLIASSYISETMSIINSDINIGFVFSSVIISDLFDVKKKKYYRVGNSGVYKSKTFINKVLYSDQAPVSPGCCIFRLTDLRSALALNITSPKFNDFSEHGAGPDLLTYLYCAEKYEYFGFIDKPLSFFREHQGSISLSMKKIDLLDRYNQAKLWFSQKHLPYVNLKELSSYIWVEKCFYARKIYPLKSIPEFFGVGIPRPEFLFILKFGLKKIYMKVHGNLFN